MVPTHDLIAKQTLLLREVGDMVADCRRYLKRLCEYEEERRVEERRLTAMAESILPAKRTAALDPEVPLSEWGVIPWSEEKEPATSAPVVQMILEGEEWWYRDLQRVYRERGSDRPLTMEEIELIHNPPGRDRPRRKVS